MGYKYAFLIAMTLVLLCLGTAVSQAQGQTQTRVQVQVQNLSQVEPFRVGAHSRIPFKMPLQQWRGTSAKIAANLISDLPEVGSSPLLNRLTASVLISPSNPPAGSKDDIALASLRLASIYRLGQLEAVVTIAERSAGGLSDPENAAVATRAFLALGQDSDACETAIRLQTGRSAVFWLKVRAFCLAREGRSAAAELTADLVLEVDPEDIDFLLALNQMLNKDTTTVAPISALELAMAKFSGAAIDADGTPFSLQSALAGHANLTELTATRKMAATGLLPVSSLKQAYTAWPGLPSQYDEQDGLRSEIIKNAEEMDAGLLVIALGQNGAAQAALVYQSALRASTPMGRALALNEGLKLEKELGGFFAIARLYAPLLLDLPIEATASNDPMNRRFFYALLAADHPVQARRFAKPDNPAMQRLFFLSQKTGTSLPNAKTSDEAMQGRAADLVYTDLITLLALDARLNDHHRNFLFTHNLDKEEYAQCTPGARTAIMDGARNGARAASILRSAMMLADSGFDRVAPQCGAAVITAFRTMGYDGLARQGALEMMLAPRLQGLANLDE